VRNRWLVVIALASLCLNAAVVGTYFLRRAGPHRPRRFPHHRLPFETRERLKQARAAAMPGFSALLDSVQATDSLLWVEIRRDVLDSARVESLCQELGRFHARMRATAFGQMHRELQLLLPQDRARYLEHMLKMRPGFCGPRPGRGCPPGPRPRMTPSGPPPEAGD